MENTIKDSLPLVDGDYDIQGLLSSHQGHQTFQGVRRTTGELVEIHIANQPAVAVRLQQQRQALIALKEVAGFPKVHLYHSQHADQVSILVLDRLGPDLESLRQVCGGHFTLKSTVMIARQVLSRYQNMRDHGITHGAVRPETISIGWGKLGAQLYLTDMSAARISLSPSEIEQEEAIVTDASEKALSINQTVFQSVRAQLGQRVEPCDDLESVIYLMVYFLQGYLPWAKQADVGKRGKDTSLQMLMQKQNSKSPAWCKVLPQIFHEVWEWILTRPQGQRPYAVFGDVLDCYLRSEGHRLDAGFDWLVHKAQGADGSAVPSCSAMELPLRPAKDTEVSPGSDEAAVLRCLLATRGQWQTMVNQRRSETPTQEQLIVYFDVYKLLLGQILDSLYATRTLSVPSGNAAKFEDAEVTCLVYFIRTAMGQFVSAMNCPGSIRKAHEQGTTTQAAVVVAALALVTAAERYTIQVIGAMVEIVPGCSYSRIRLENLWSVVQGNRSPDRFEAPVLGSTGASDEGDPLWTFCEYPG